MSNYPHYNQLLTYWLGLLYVIQIDLLWSKGWNSKCVQILSFRVNLSSSLPPMQNYQCWTINQQIYGKSMRTYLKQSLLQFTLLKFTPQVCSLGQTWAAAQVYSSSFKYSVNLSSSLPPMQNCQWWTINWWTTYWKSICSVRPHLKWSLLKKQSLLKFTPQVSIQHIYIF